MNAIDKRRARVKRRKDAGILPLKMTEAMLTYIGTLDQPEREYGGFHDTTIQAARSALYHMRRLRKQSNALGERCAVAHTLHPIVGNSELEVR